MANCSDMNVGDLFLCEKCGLELSVRTPCTCEPGEDGCCTVPLKCCGQEMTKK